MKTNCLDANCITKDFSCSFDNCYYNPNNKTMTKLSDKEKAQRYDLIHKFLEENRVEILLQDDTLYHLFVDYQNNKKSFAASLTPFQAILEGMYFYNKEQQNKKIEKEEKQRMLEVKKEMNKAQTVLNEIYKNAESEESYNKRMQNTKQYMKKHHVVNKVIKPLKK